MMHNVAAPKVPTTLSKSALLSLPNQDVLALVFVPYLAVFLHNQLSGSPEKPRHLP